LAWPLLAPVFALAMPAKAAPLASKSPWSLCLKLIAQQLA
jgi:hypothetical protein